MKRVLGITILLLLIMIVGTGCDGGGEDNLNQPSSTASLDQDNDGVLDTVDAFSNNPNETIDTDGDGTGNNADIDDGNDGYNDAVEIAAGTDSFDANSKPAASPSDSDGDGVLDADDKWPNDSTKPVLSTLWGAYGEDWDPAGRFPFVGMAGYRDGMPIPNVTRIVADVTNYGATPGVGTALDTQAFLDAIAHARTQIGTDNNGVIYVPAGIYEVDKLLHLDTSGLILRGEGRDKTEIHFVNHDI